MVVGLEGAWLARGAIVSERSGVADTCRTAGGAESYQHQWRRAGARRWTTVSVKGGKKAVAGLGRGALYELRVRGVSGEARGKWSKASLRWLRGVSKAKAAPGRARGSVRAAWAADGAATGGFRVFRLRQEGRQAPQDQGREGRGHVRHGEGPQVRQGYYARVRPYRAEGGATYSGALSGRRAARAR